VEGVGCQGGNLSGHMQHFVNMVLALVMDIVSILFVAAIEYDL
jgi:hypothetical protein